MIITKQQSKRLRYICGTAAYNQPCVKKYTGRPDGKIRQIGKFKYIEHENELVYFEYDGDVVPLSNYEAEEFLSALMDDRVFHLGSDISVEDRPPAEVNGHNDIGDVATRAVECQVHIEVPPKNEVREINIPVETPPAIDDWMDDDGNDPDSLDHGTADIPVLLTEEEKKAAEEDNIPAAICTSTEIPHVEITAHSFAKEDAEKSIEDVEVQPLTEAPALPLTAPDAFKEIKGVEKPAPPAKTPKQMSPEELTEDVIREISMTAAAREAARLHQIPCMGLPDVPSQNIIRTNASIPGFLDDYGKCLKKVGMARTLAEIAKALPAQIDWIFR